MKNFILQAICGAATGLCIAVTLLLLALSKTWPEGAMDDPGLTLTMVLFIVAIPFLILTTVIGTIVGIVVEFARRIVVRHKQNQEEP